MSFPGILSFLTSGSVKFYGDETVIITGLCFDTTTTSTSAAPSVVCRQASRSGDKTRQKIWAISRKQAHHIKIYIEQKMEPILKKK